MTYQLLEEIEHWFHLSCLWAFSLSYTSLLSPARGNHHPEFCAYQSLVFLYYLNTRLNKFGWVLQVLELYINNHTICILLWLPFYSKSNSWDWATLIIWFIHFHWCEFLHSPVLGHAECFQCFAIATRLLWTFLCMTPGTSEPRFLWGKHPGVQVPAYMV